MSHFDRSLRSQFFLTGPRPCPYLPNLRERKLFTALSGPSASALHDELAHYGFRRSQNIAYRPACSGCNACVSTRVAAFAFSATKSQRRVVKRNLDLQRAAVDPQVSDEHYALFSRYLAARHPNGGMTEMDLLDFSAMVEDSPVRTRMIEYRVGAADEGGAPSPEAGRLVAACVTDVLADGLSLVYSFFDPSLNRRSLGQFVILDHIALARSAGLPYVYLGYWVPGSAKMDYKIKFRPAEILTDHGWRPHASTEEPAHVQVRQARPPEPDGAPDAAGLGADALDLPTVDVASASAAGDADDGAVFDELLEQLNKS